MQKLRCAWEEDLSEQRVALQPEKIIIHPNNTGSEVLIHMLHGANTGVANRGRDDVHSQRATDPESQTHAEELFSHRFTSESKADSRPEMRFQLLYLDA